MLLLTYRTSQDIREKEPDPTAWIYMFRLWTLPKFKKNDDF